MPDAPRNLRLIEHPLLAHMLTEARRVQTPTPRFRELVGRIGALIAYEATRDLATTTMDIDTPLEKMPARRLATPVTIVPILRAGLGMAQGVIELLPEARVGHVGIFRDERSLNPVSYYHKIPPEAAGGVVMLVDPMLATGGSASAAVTLLRKLGCRDVRMLCVLAAPEGLAKLHGSHPEVPVFAAALDRQLDGRGFILPGLGDAGDRLFGTSAVEP